MNRTPAAVAVDLLRLKDSVDTLNRGTMHERSMAATVERRIEAIVGELAGHVWYEANQPRTPVADVVHMEGQSQ